MHIFLNKFNFSFLYIFLISLFFLFSCDENKENNPNNQTVQTEIQFENLEEYPAIIYSDASRLNVFTEVGSLSQKTIKSAPAPHGTAFYPTFLFSFKVGNIDKIIPLNGETIIAAIEADKTNLVKIPKLTSIEFNTSYVFLVNNSDYSLSFREGNTEKTPLGGGTSIINSGSSAAYEIMPGIISGYSIRKNTTDIAPFPTNLTEFRHGIIYELTYTNTGLELTKETDILDFGSYIKWTNDINGTLNVNNKSSKDMVLFLGMPNNNNLIGGVKTGVIKDFYIASKINNFETGGLAVIYGISIDEYNANIDNLTSAKREYSAMIIYGQGKTYKIEITSLSMGEYMYRISNPNKYGIELRKNSPDGEKIGFIPALSVNVSMYANSSEPFSIVPVFVVYNNVVKEIVTYVPIDNNIFQGMPYFVTISPKGMNSNEIQTYIINIENLTISLSTAYINIINNTTLPCEVGIGNTILKSVNGLNIISSGQTLTYSILSTTEGMQQNIILKYQVSNLPVRFSGETTPPVIKNGYQYTITVTGSGSNTENILITLIDNGVIPLDYIISSL